MNFRTCDSIIADMTSIIEKKEMIPPEKYIEGAFYLNILSLAELTKLNKMEYEIAKETAIHIRNGHSNADAKSLVKAEESYLEMKNQEAKVKVINQTLLLAKKWATITGNSMNI